MRGATVATTSSRALLQGCQKLGLDCQALLTAAGLSEAEVNDPDARLPGEAVAALWQAAFERSADPDLGLRIALAVPFGAYRVIDFLAASAATVGEGLLKVARYFPLINSALRWEISDHEGNRQVALTHERLASALPRPYAEYALTVTVLHCRRASGFDWPLREVWFAFEAPEAGREHALALGCPVVFGKPKNAFLMAPATWDLPSQAASSALLSTLEAHAERMLTSLFRTKASQHAFHSGSARGTHVD